MDLHLTEAAVVVTGASAGIGEATVRVPAAEGATVLAVARHPEGVGAAGPQASGLAADLAEPGAAQCVMEEVLTRHGRLDGLVNNVGALDSRTGFLNVSDEQRHATFELNFHSAVRMTRAALPALLIRGGSLAHVTSEAARRRRTRHRLPALSPRAPDHRRGVGRRRRCAAPDLTLPCKAPSAVTAAVAAQGGQPANRPGRRSARVPWPGPLPPFMGSRR